MFSWTLAVLAMVLVPPLLSALLDLVQKPRDVQLDQHLRAGFSAGMLHLARIALGLAWLPHEVQYQLDAIVRTLWRMAVSHRHLLQWQTSSEVERRSSNAPAALWRLMWIGPLLAVLLGAALALERPLACLLAAPLLLLWLLSPALAWWISQPRKADAFAPTPGAAAFPAHAGAPHLGLLRNVRRPSRPLAAAGQPAGTAPARWSRIAPRRPTSAWRCWRTWPASTSVSSAPAACSIAPATR